MALDQMAILQMALDSLCFYAIPAFLPHTYTEAGTSTYRVAGKICAIVTITACSIYDHYVISPLYSLSLSSV